MLRLPLVGPFVVAASGGADSGAALVLLRAVAPRARIVACYVDHGLRPAASIARDLAAVKAQARFAQASVAVRRLTLGTTRHGSHGSPEERARVARYRALAAVARNAGAGVVVTGHQQDDLAETSLLALARGSGIDGVAAMRPLRVLAKGVRLARPLLWASKAQCASLLEALDVPTSYDETNDNRAIPRNALRTFVAQLERAMPGSTRAIARSAALLADDKALLDGLCAAAWRSARHDKEASLRAATLRRMPVALVRRVIRHALSTSGASLRYFSYEHCDAIALAIKQGRGGSYHAGSASVLLSAGKVIIEPLSASPAPHLAPIRVDLDVLPRDVVTPLGTATLRSATHNTSTATKRAPLVQHLDLGALRRTKVEIRLPQPGDTCIPAGRRRAVSLARFLGKSGVPRSHRVRTPILCAGGRIAAVLGIRVMEPFRPKGKSARLEVAWYPADS